MFKNLKIKSKIMMASGVIMLLAIVVIIWLLDDMNKVARATEQLYKESYAANENMWIVRRNLIDTARELNKLASTDRKKVATMSSQTEKVLDSDFTAIENSISIMNEMYVQDKDKMDLLQNIEELVTKASATRTEILNLIKNNDPDKAIVMLESEYRPSFEKAAELALQLGGLIDIDAADFVSNSKDSANRAIIVGIVLLLITLILSIIIITKVATVITKPLVELEEVAHAMTQGNLSAAEMLTYESNDELGTLAKSMKVTMTTLSAYVDEISKILKSLSKGDLTIPRDNITDFLGEFAEIKHSIVTILKSFNSTLGDISEASEQVESSSSQVSDGAQMLAQGATEQAEAIEELNTSVGQISEQIRQNAENTKSADQLTKQVEEEVEVSNRYMTEMRSAMNDINSSSQEIGKIIKTIEDIAFQTNILALNAAVEAARAGAAGKGFAVVADEVRSLAEKSAEASKNTTVLIENSMNAVANGLRITDQTAKALEVVKVTTGEVVNTVDNIANATNRQATTVEQVSMRVEQISSVVQQNSATAEESAASSEEMSGQAAHLEELVKRFQLFRG